MLMVGLYNLNPHASPMGSMRTSSVDSMWRLAMREETAV